jgi:two-component system CheB/CheR fusion protein
MSESAANPPFDNLLQHLQQTRGFDFTAYKRTSLMRRVNKRMQTVGVDSYDAYYDYLQVHQDEFAALFNTILINVTGFYRDPEVWTTLSNEVIPAIIRERGRDRVIRVWSAGCASGQEPYTVAMTLAEALGPEVARDHMKIYATDVDDEALNEARQATYEERQVADVPPRLLDKYFEHSGSKYTFNRDLRRSIIFGRHDLVQDAPISRIDLLLCRNTLMYFNADVQARILARFYFSLNSGGCVVLGRAEMLFSHAALFTPVDLKRRLFRAVPRPSHRDRLMILAQTGRDFMANHLPTHARLREIAFDSDTAPQVVLDASSTIAAMNAPARERFNLAAADVGRPFQDLEVSYRPVELRGAVDQVQRERRQLTIKDVSWTIDAEPRFFDVSITPLRDEDESLLGIRISFQDVSAYRQLQLELQHSKQELETAYEELQSTNEELETTNEELQSTVEELETTNEELQSTNEELETMNEELQSTNEELQTMNDELRTRSTDLNVANAFLESVFASLQAAVVVMDKELKILVWNDRASDLWGVRPEEARGSHFMNLDIGLPLGDLRPAIKTVLNDGAEQHQIVVPAVNRRGKPFECRVTLTPLMGGQHESAGVILLMEERKNS